MDIAWIALAYVGPETVLPVGSALAAAGGLLLVFGQRIKRFLVRLACLMRRRDDGRPTDPA